MGVGSRWAREDGVVWGWRVGGMGGRGWGVKSEGENGRGGGCSEMMGVVPQVSQSGGDHGGTPTHAAPRSRLGGTLANARVTRARRSTSLCVGGEAKEDLVLLLVFALFICS